jgi:prepilin-type N-terminal cleavage/methylation domain-containing protein
MSKRGFTLIELLVAVAIIAILSTLVILTVNRVRQAGALTREISGCRQLITAYLQAAGDRDGELIIGYAAHEGAEDDRGKAVPNPACGRYPWRVAKYLGYKLRGTLLVNEQESITPTEDYDEFVYRVSANPSFGINATYVGGNERTGIMPSPATLKRYGKFMATRLNEVSQPSKLMVFASSRYSGSAGFDIKNDEAQSGFHLLHPPRTTYVHWRGTYDASDPAQNFGFLHLRHNRRAVCAMLGGNVELLDERQLQDMRHWSHQAAEADDPEYVLKKLQ